MKDCFDLIICEAEPRLRSSYQNVNAEVLEDRIFQKIRHLRKKSFQPKKSLNYENLIKFVVRLCFLTLR